MATLATYLQGLRNERRMSRARLAELVGTTEMSILRIETKGQEPSASLLVRMVGALGASWEMVSRLVEAPDANDEDGRAATIAALAPQSGETTDESSRLNRLIDLLADGVSPAEAARRVRQEQ